MNISPGNAQYDQSGPFKTHLIYCSFQLVPHENSQLLSKRLLSPDVDLTLIPGGSHFLSVDLLLTLLPTERIIIKPTLKLGSAKVLLNFLSKKFPENIWTKIFLHDKYDDSRGRFEIFKRSLLLPGFSPSL